MILLDEHMTSVIHDALDADVFAIGLAEEFVGLVVVGTEFVVFAHVALLARELQGDVVFGKVGGFYLGAVLVAAGWAV